MDWMTDERLRKAIVRARKQEKLTYVQIATRLGVGEATVNRILRLHRETGSVKPRPRGGGNRSPIHDEVAVLLTRIVEELPDATIQELTDALLKRADIDTSRSAVQRAMQRLGFSRKKRPSPPSSATRPSGARTAARSASGSSR
jgi:transposase